MDDFHISTVIFFKLLQALNKEKILSATKEPKPVISDVERNGNLKERNRNLNLEYSSASLLRCSR